MAMGCQSPIATPSIATPSLKIPDPPAAFVRTGAWSPSAARTGPWTYECSIEQVEKSNRNHSAVHSWANRCNHSTLVRRHRKLTGVEATSVTQTGTGLPNFTTTVLTSADDVPDQWRGLSACDMLIMATSPASPSTAAAGDQAKPVIDSLSPMQWSAIEDWCQHGGTIVFSLSQYATELAADSPLASLMPGPIVEHLTNIDSGTLESATATKIRLGPITAVRLGNVRGKVELAMVDNGARRFPWWIRYSLGKGVIHCVASDWINQPEELV